MQKIAANYYESGLHVIPLVPDAKNPAINTWDPLIRLENIKTHFNNDNNIGLVCGKVSGSIEALDFDNHFGDAELILNEFHDVEGVSAISDKIYIERTIRGGFHLVYKCKEIGNSKKLANRLCTDKKNYPNSYDLKDGKTACLIETRGEGGYIVCAPSVGYEVISGDITDIQEITPDERSVLITAALSLNEYHIEIYAADPIQGTGSGERPGDIFNNSPESAQIALDLLFSNGWTQARNKRHLVRPNKNIKNGISATFGHVAPGVLNVFSSNAHPFEQSHGYKPYQILGLLKFNGDFTECSKWLRSEGYFDKRTISKQDKQTFQEAVKKNLKDGRFLSPQEINEIAEKLDVPVDKAQKFVKKCESSLKEIDGYEDWPAVKKAEYFLSKNYQFRIDIIRRIAEMRKNDAGWETLNEHSIYRHMLTDEPKLKFSLDNIKSLLKSDYVDRYNPFIDYFEKIKKADGTDWIGKLCKFFDVDDKPYFISMIKKALVRQIKCAIEPNYYNRIVLVLSSEQEEIGKSHFFMWLNPFGALYYSDEVLSHNKDSRLALTENFIYNLEELDGLSKYGSAKLKATISTRGVTDRLPYAASKEYFARCCTFWGSTNEKEFLMNDKNTRWLPFNVASIDWRGYVDAIDVKDIWAQAWSLYCSDFDCELTADEKKIRNERNEIYRVEDIEESVIKKHYVPDPTSFMTNAEVLAGIQLKADGLKVTWNSVSLGKTLGRLGFTKRRKDNQRGWGICEVNLFGESDTSPF